MAGESIVHEVCSTEDDVTVTIHCEATTCRHNEECGCNLFNPIDGDNVHALNNLRIPTQTGHLLRLKPATEYDPNRPPIMMNPATPE
jgi:hypothetical protein